MTGIAIVAFLVVFLWYCAKHAKKQKLNRSSLRTNIPLYCILIYFTASYFRYLISDFVIFPLSLNQIMQYISPYEYQFHLVGVLIGCAICARHFFSRITDPRTHIQRVDTIFLSIMVACIPLGFFLLLGDTFIGQPTQNGFSITAIHPESNVAIYNKVIPLGLYLSLLGTIMFLGTKIYTSKHTNTYGYGFYGLAIFLIGLCLIVLFQVYPRHIVLGFLGKTRDIKNYALLGTAGIMIRLYITKYKYYSKLK